MQEDSDVEKQREVARTKPLCADCDCDDCVAEEQHASRVLTANEHAVFWNGVMVNFTPILIIACTFADAILNHHEWRLTDVLATLAAYGLLARINRSES